MWRADSRDTEPVYTRRLPASDGSSPAVFVCSFPEDTGSLQVRVSYGGTGYFEITSLTVQSQGWLCNDTAAIAVFILLLLAVYLILYLEKQRQNRAGEHRESLPPDHRDLPADQSPSVYRLHQRRI